MNGDFFLWEKVKDLVSKKLVDDRISFRSDVLLYGSLIFIKYRDV